MDNDSQLKISYPVDPQSLIGKTIMFQTRQFELVSLLGMGAEKIVYGLKDTANGSVSLVLKVFRKKMSKGDLNSIISSHEELKKYFGDHVLNSFVFFIDDWPVEIQPYIDLNQPGVISIGGSTDVAFSEGRDSLKQIAELYEMDRFEQALAKCNIKLEEFPLHPNYLAFKGECLLALGSAKEAIDVINLCIELEPGELRHHSNLERAEVLLAVFTEAEHRNLSPELLLLQRLAATSLKNAIDVIDLHIDPEPNEPNLQIKSSINFKRACFLLRGDTVFTEVEHKDQLPYELLLQSLVTMALIERYETNSIKAGRLLLKTASDLQAHARHTEAELLYQRALEILEQQLGLEHPDVAIALNNLANIYSEQGKHAQAEPLCQRALEIWEQQLGPEHPNVAVTLNNLAALYGKQGKHAQAEPLYQRALEIREQQLGPEHPSVATSLNELANIYSEQGKYAQAEPLYQRALEIWEQQLGPEHPDVAIALHNLANIYSEQGKYDQAEPLYVRALSICEHVLGPHHPRTSAVRKHYASLLRAMDRDSEAEKLEKDS